MTLKTFAFIGLLAAAAPSYGQYTFYPNDATINYTLNSNAVIGYGSYYPWQNGHGTASPHVGIIAPASISGWAGASAYSFVTMSGGTVGRLLADDHASLRLTGGTVLNDFGVGFNTVSEILGGTVMHGVVVEQNARVTISGGNFSGGYLGGGVNFILRDHSVATFVGTGITATYLYSQFSTKYYGLSGTLEDGHSLTGKLLAIDPNASFQVQVAPEPQSIAAFGVGALALLRRRAKRSK